MRELEGNLANQEEGEFEKHGGGRGRKGGGARGGAPGPPRNCPGIILPSSFYEGAQAREPNPRGEKY